MKCPYCNSETFKQIKLTEKIIKEVDEDFNYITCDEEETLYLVLKCAKCGKLIEKGE